jgi:hypothetical protein
MSKNYSPHSDRRYWAFISYSHSDTKETAWLHKALENYKVPGYLIGTETRTGVVPRRIFPVFRDRDELPTSSDLGGNLHAALRNSRYLVVVCSPRSAKSIWVDAEVNYFKKHHGGGNVLCLVVDGVPGGNEDSECFCPSLRVKIGPGGELTDEAVEPIAADMREGKDGRRRAFLKIAAGILGVDFDSLYQRDKKRRRNRLIAFSSAALVGLAMLALFYSRLDKVAKSQSEMASQVQKMQEAKFREFGSLPKERIKALQEIFNKSGLRAFKSEWESVILNNQKRFTEYEERVDKPYIQKLQNYKELKKQAVLKLEEFLSKIQPEEGWGNSKTILDKLPEDHMFDHSFAQMMNAMRSLNDIEVKYQNELANLEKKNFPESIQRNQKELMEMGMKAEKGIYERYLDDAKIWDDAAGVSLKTGDMLADMKELSKILAQLLDAFPAEYLSREGFDEEYPKLGNAELGSDELNDMLGKYRRIYGDKSAFDALKDNAERTLSNLLGRDALYVKQSDKEAELYESDEVKKLSAEEKIVFQEFFNAFREENNLVDSADSAHEKLVEDCLSKKQKLIDETLNVLGLTSYMNNEANGGSDHEQQFCEKLWRVDTRNKSQYSLELYCLSRLVFVKTNETGASELDMDKIRMTRQFSMLAAKALGVQTP